jgi:hypothetical protein
MQVLRVLDIKRHCPDKKSILLSGILLCLKHPQGCPEDVLWMTPKRVFVEDVPLNAARARSAT